MSKASAYATGSDKAVAAIRMQAAELLIEATERGDLDAATVDWAVVRLLNTAAEADRR